MSKLSEIFAKQAELVDGLRPIYLKNGFNLHAKPFPWPLDDRHYQEEFRLLAWRFTEELQEARAEMIILRESKETLREEIADAFHFLVELGLAIGMAPDSGLPPLETIESLPTAHWKPHLPFWFCVSSMAALMVSFRQRPWRTDNRLTWTARVHQAFNYLLIDFYRLCKELGISSDELFSAYMAKNAVNHQRKEDALR